MSKSDLYTVTMRRSMPITTLKGVRNEDIVETFHNMTWEDSLGLRKKFSNVEDITVQKTASGSRNAPSKKAGYQVAVGGKPVVETQTPKVRVRRKRGPGVKIPGSLADLVNIMAEKETA